MGAHGMCFREEMRGTFTCYPLLSVMGCNGGVSCLFSTKIEQLIFKSI